MVTPKKHWNCNNEGTNVLKSCL